MTEEDSVVNSFIENYNRIDQQLRRLANIKEYKPFPELLASLTRFDVAIRLYEGDLRRLHELRNMLVHQAGARSVAIPNAWAARRIAEIAAALTSPPHALSIANRPVTTCLDTDSLQNVVVLMCEKSYSQIPVIRDGKLVSVLTTNVIARWLAQPANNEIADVMATTVKQVLKCASPEDRKSYKLIRLDQTIFDVLGLFSPGNREYTIDSVLISANGKSTETIMGIITPEDLPKIIAGVLPGA